jgi:hypothetical protein
VYTGKVLVVAGHGQQGRQEDGKRAGDSHYSVLRPGCQRTSSPLS